MPEDFDRFIASALSAPERAPDRRFVRLVESRIAMEQRLEGERRAMLGKLVQQLVALSAVAAALCWGVRAPLLASLFAESPGIGLAILLAVFAFVIALLTLQPTRMAAAFRPCE